jgi:hypothetical protein
MADGCTLGVWTFKCTVVHSVSDSPVGPFERVGVAAPRAEAHNPVISRAVDGDCPNPSAAPTGCAHQQLKCEGGQDASWTTTVHSSN